MLRWRKDEVLSLGTRAQQKVITEQTAMPREAARAQVACTVLASWFEQQVICPQHICDIRWAGLFACKPTLALLQPAVLEQRQSASVLLFSACLSRRMPSACRQ